MNDSILSDPAYDTSLAIIGMSGRFPGANGIQDFWRKIVSGEKSIHFFTDQELLTAGEDLKALQDPLYIKAGAILQDVDLFDAAFFGFTPREAECTDPQHRLFLECSWEALEQAGYVPNRYEGLIGVFAGSAFPTYLLNNLVADKDLLEVMGKIQVAVGNERDSLASKVSYKLNLRGPAVGVQTFCSTSLVATHLACQSLLNYECDIALAGGVAIATPQVRGYYYEEGGILSSDGACRTFDATASGSVMGNGLGVVVLKRLKEAIKDGDYIYACVRGSAVNNDGSVRVGYTAPGLDGQSEVIAEAISRADVPFESIGYIEAHGTATRLGDAIELAALIKAFAPETKRRQFCALGSVKPNIGHLDRASGVTGLIKTSLALHHKLLPPHLNFETTSSDIDLHQSPFYVNTHSRSWAINGNVPRRAGVNSFGLGGTNAHVVLEEAPKREESPLARPWSLLPLSARSAGALRQSALNLAKHLREQPDEHLADVAYTLQTGRTTFNYRQVLVCSTLEEASERLCTLAEQSGDDTPAQIVKQHPVVFLLPDTLEPCVNMARDLYVREEQFRATVERCNDVLKERFSYDLCAAIYPPEAEGASTLVSDPMGSQCATFVVTYALSQLLLSWGIRPRALLAYGVGEYVAAALASVLKLEDALTLAVEHVVLPQEERLARLVQRFQGLDPQTPQIPYLSGSVGGWMKAEQIRDLPYWDNLLRDTRNLKGAFSHLSHEKEWVLLEVGTGQAVYTAIQQLGATQTWQCSIATLPMTEQHEALRQVLAALGKLWLNGVEINWHNYYQQEKRRRVPLPTYPFERQRYWVEPNIQRIPEQTGVPQRGKKREIAEWFYAPIWQQVPLTVAIETALTFVRSYLIFVDQKGIGERLASQLEQAGALVFRVLAGQQFHQVDTRTFSIAPTDPGDYQALLSLLTTQGQLPEHIIHCWSLIEQAEHTSGPTYFKALQETGFYSLLHLVKALERQKTGGRTYLTVISNGIQSVTGTEMLCPEKATLLGLCKVVSQEDPTIVARSIDLEAGQPDEPIAHLLVADILAITSERSIAYRRRQRWTETFVSQRLEAPGTSPLRTKGVYLITGGLGGVGLILAKHLAQSFQARLVLVSRSGLPDRSQWMDWLAVHDGHNATTQRIRQVQELEELGASVLVLQADVADREQIRAVLDKVDATFGSLHGVIHAAGVSERAAFGTAQEISVQACEWHFQPKVYGLYALAAALQGRQLDFCLLFSSLSTVLGGLGLVAYAAANCFMDAFAYQHNRAGEQPWRCIDWDSWQVKEHAHGALGATIAEYTMTPLEGVEAFMRCLSGEQTHLVNSTGDLQARLQQWVMLESLNEPSEEEEEEIKTTMPETLVRSASRPETACERILTGIWQQVLGIKQVGLYDNFFDLGGNSLIAIQVVSRIRKIMQVQIPVVALFEAPTIHAMAQYLGPNLDAAQQPPPQQVQPTLEERRGKAHQPQQVPGIAIIGMTGRFPGVSNLDEFWHNLRNGIESITFFTDEELLQAGVAPELIRDPAYVKARPVLKAEVVETFEAPFFGFSQREAELTDPQQRLFLECVWEALEHAGYDPQRYQGSIGLFGGANISTYMLSLMKNRELLADVNDDQLAAGNDKDALTTSISYRLNLRGPSLTVQTFCSTSLVAVHLACQSLLNRECDMALAGGISVRVPYNIGHLYQKGGIASPDGHCRTFDAKAKGTMYGDGAGIVVLKRLEDALKDGDTIHAVIKGSAINNDGSLKVSYNSPSVNGQAEVVMRALARANVPAESISYIEAHGAATELGDPIEVASLTKAFRSQTAQNNFCAIGSVKTNVGHLDRASGTCGLIKTVLSLKHREIPPSLYFESPNPEIDFEQSPFFVNTRLRPWPSNGKPRRAGISSLGMGGTNAHVIIEESPVVVPSGPSRPQQLLFLSARTTTALEAMTENLRTYIQEHPEVPLADIAYTLQTGRKQMEMRRMILCRDHEEAVWLLDKSQQVGQLTHAEKRFDRPVVWLFPDIGEQRVSMARDLYEHEPFFREAVDRCSILLASQLQLDLCATLYPEMMANASGLQNGPDANLAAPQQCTANSRQVLAQCSTFVIEYALAQLLLSWGVYPQALLGNGLGEYVAATLAGVFSLEDALTLVLERARLIASFLEGATHMREPLKERIAQLVQGMRLQEPQIPYISNVTGDWMSEELASDPHYWSEHIGCAVRFAEGLERVLSEEEWILLEVGPGQSLSSQMKQRPGCNEKRQSMVISTLPEVSGCKEALPMLLQALGKLWLNGAEIDWQGFYRQERRLRVPLPTYPFERQRYWLQPVGGKRSKVEAGTALREMVEAEGERV